MWFVTTLKLALEIILELWVMCMFGRMQFYEKQALIIVSDVLFRGKDFLFFFFFFPTEMWNLIGHYTRVRGRVNNSLQPSLFSSHGCIYTKVAVSTSSMNLCLSCHVTWTVLHAWLYYGIGIKTIHFGHCLWNREVRCINCPTWFGVLLHILLYLQNKSMECGDFWNTYKSINSLLYDTLFNSYSW